MPTDARSTWSDLIALLPSGTGAIGADDIRAIVKSFPVTADAVAPTAADDSAAGYEVGTFWLKTTAPVTLYQCDDNTAGAAVWTVKHPLTAADVGAVQPGDDVSTLGSGAAAAGDVPKADGAGNVAWGPESGGGASSPLTTKGDLWGFDTGDARLPVGTDGQVLTADSAAALGVSYQTPATGSGGGGPLSIDARTGTAETLTLANAEGMVTLDNASPITLTVPPNSSVAFPIGTTIALVQLGAGQVTVAAGAGVTIQSYGSLLSIAAQNLPVSLTKLATDTWLLTGALA